MFLPDSFSLQFKYFCHKKDQPESSYGLAAIATSPKGFSGTDAESLRSKEDSLRLGLPSVTTLATGNAPLQSS